MTWSLFLLRAVADMHTAGGRPVADRAHPPPAGDRQLSRRWFGRKVVYRVILLHQRLLFSNRQSRILAGIRNELIRICTYAWFINNPRLTTCEPNRN